ncbi:hypothetical protein [Caballeronia sp. RCC_10]
MSSNLTASTNASIEPRKSDDFTGFLFFWPGDIVVLLCFSFPYVLLSAIP